MDIKRIVGGIFQHHHDGRTYTLIEDDFGVYGKSGCCHIFYNNEHLTTLSSVKEAIRALPTLSFGCKLEDIINE